MEFEKKYTLQEIIEIIESGKWKNDSTFYDLVNFEFDLMSYENGYETPEQMIEKRGAYGVALLITDDYPFLLKN